MGVSDGAEGRGVLSAGEHADDEPGAGVGSGFQVPGGVSGDEDPCHVVDPESLHGPEHQVVRAIATPCARSRASACGTP